MSLDRTVTWKCRTKQTLPSAMLLGHGVYHSSRKSCAVFCLFCFVFLRAGVEFLLFLFLFYNVPPFPPLPWWWPWCCSSVCKMYFVPFLPLALVLNNLTLIYFSNFPCSWSSLDFLPLCVYSLYHIWEHLAYCLALTVLETKSRTSCILYEHSITELHVSMSCMFWAFLPFLFFKDFSYVHSRPFEVP